jgi:hypothetical protein
MNMNRRNFMHREGIYQFAILDVGASRKNTMIMLKDREPLIMDELGTHTSQGLLKACSNTWFIRYTLSEEHPLPCYRPKWMLRQEVNAILPRRTH